MAQPCANLLGDDCPLCGSANANSVLYDIVVVKHGLVRDARIRPRKLDKVIREDLTNFLEPARRR